MNKNIGMYVMTFGTFFLLVISIAYLGKTYGGDLFEKEANEQGEIAPCMKKITIF